MADRDYINPAFPHFVHGGDYNPEQWLETKSVWDDDMRLMNEASCNEMTVGIFSWAVLEPEEDRFDFSFLDEIIGRIYDNGGRVILATPSGARPRWLAEKYPEVLRVRPDGTRNRFGERHNHCYTSPAYRERVRIINTELAKRYSHHPAVIAWHVSNEYGGECFCPLCAEAFRNYLREKYSNDISLLNRAYWTSFWSHQYRDFSDIEPPSGYTDSGIHGLNLDWMRFVTRQTVDFMKAETEPLRKENPDIPVTTNMMYDFGGLDYFAFRDVIDFASWDCYPEWHSGDDAKTAAEAAFWHDFYRSLKKRPFFLMESTPSLVNWHAYNKPKRPGLDTLSSLQAVFHGSDSVQYFQWRAGRGSCEKLHGSVVGHGGTGDTRTFRSVKRTGDVLKAVDEICGTRVRAEAAIVMDWENRWALDDAQAFARYGKKYSQTLYMYHRILWMNGMNCDIVHPQDDLSPYKLVIAPMLYLTDSRTIGNLASYVENGGTLLSTYHLGTVDGTDLCYLGETPAGKLSDVFGIVREETDTLYPDQHGTVSYLGKTYVTSDIAEVIRAREARVLAEYSSDYYSGTPAFTVNVYGSGKAYYQAFRGNGDFEESVISALLDETGIATNIPPSSLPYGTTAHTRTDGENTYLFVENYSPDASGPVPLGETYTDMLSGQDTSAVSLPGYGFSILKNILTTYSPPKKGKAP